MPAREGETSRPNHQKGIPFLTASLEYPVHCSQAVHKPAMARVAFPPSTPSHDRRQKRDSQPHHDNAR